MALTYRFKAEHALCRQQSLDRVHMPGSFDHQCFAFSGQSTFILLCRARWPYHRANPSSPAGPLDQRIEQFFDVDPIRLCPTRIGQAHLLLAHTDEAIAWLEKATRATPGAGGSHAWLAAAYALKGETERAGSELAEARRRALPPEGR